MIHNKQHVVEVRGSQLEVGDLVFKGSYVFRQLNIDRLPVLITSIVESSGRGMQYREVAFATARGEVVRTVWPDDVFVVQSVNDHSMGDRVDSMCSSSTIL